MGMTPAEPGTQATRTLEIEGMHCDACARRLTGAFSAVPGVTSAHVSLSPPEARLQTSRPVPLEDLRRAARSAGAYSVREPAAPAGAPGPEPIPAHPAQPTSLYPLALIVLYILGVTLLTTFIRGPRDLHTLMNDFMAGFFLVFSFFKLLDLRGFADAYASYDLIARRSRAWALAYPFVELALGIAYLVRWQPLVTSAATLALMLLGSIGVLRALLRRDTIRCACLGTALNLPMTTVTLTEDLAMAAMAAVMLVWAR
jgi:copper chaperone CopZ